MSEELRMAPERAEKGEGSRKLDCDLYDACLDLAAKKNWDGFHCDACNHKPDQASASGTDVPGVTGKVKVLCSDCRERETLGHGSLCAHCLGVRGNRAKAAKAARAGKDKGSEQPKKAKKTQSKPKGKKVLNDANTALTIEFGKHASILREVESLADKEIRPVECQVIYMLKTQLARMEVGQAEKPPIPTP